MSGDPMGRSRPDSELGTYASVSSSSEFVRSRSRAVASIINRPQRPACGRRLELAPISTTIFRGFRFSRPFLQRDDARQDDPLEQLSELVDFQAGIPDDASHGERLALIGLCRGIVRNLAPFLMTMCLPWRIT